MQNLPRLLLVTAALALVTALAAQTDAPRGPGPRGPGGPGGRGPGGPGGPGGRGPGHPIIRVLDADQDHEISAAELKNAPAAIRALDLNGDGIVSADELHPSRPAHAPTPPPGAPPRDDTAHRRPVDPIMLALDANGDGALSAAEIANATKSLSALDLNQDGKLTPDEFRPLPPAN